MVKQKGMDSDSILSRLNVLEKKIALLESKRMIAGNHIRITKLSDQEDLIESDFAEEIPTALKSLLEEAAKGSRMQTGADLLMNESGVNIHTDSNGSRVERLLPVPEDEYSFLPDAAAEEEAEERDFPFRVRIEGTPHVAGESTNIAVSGGTNGPESLVFAGLHDFKHIQAHTFSVSQTCYVILRLSSNVAGTGSVITAEVTVENGISEGAGEYVVPLAKIRYDSGFASVFQMHFGNVFVAGRVI